jgi:hypothetical protein
MIRIAVRRRWGTEIVGRRMWRCSSKIPNVGVQGKLPIVNNRPTTTTTHNPGSAGEEDNNGAPPPAPPPDGAGDGGSPAAEALFWKRRGAVVPSPRPSLSPPPSPSTSPSACACCAGGVTALSEEPFRLFARYWSRIASAALGVGGPDVCPGAVDHGVAEIPTPVHPFGELLRV